MYKSRCCWAGELGRPMVLEQNESGRDKAITSSSVSRIVASAAGTTQECSLLPLNSAIGT